MPWALLIEVAIAFIKECLEKQEKATVKRNMRNPGPFVRFVLRRKLRQELGIKRADLDDAVEDAIAALATSNDEQLDGLIAQAESST